MAYRLDDVAQPRPLRLIAASAGLVTTVVGVLPLFGVPLTAEQIGGLGAVVSAIALIAVVMFGEARVTPLSSPRDSEGRRLVPAHHVEREDLP